MNSLRIFKDFACGSTHGAGATCPNDFRVSKVPGPPVCGVGDAAAMVPTGMGTRWRWGGDGDGDGDGLIRDGDSDGD